MRAGAINRHKHFNEMEHAGRPVCAFFFSLQYFKISSLFSSEKKFLKGLKETFIKKSLSLIFVGEHCIKFLGIVAVKTQIRKILCCTRESF